MTFPRIQPLRLLLLGSIGRISSFSTSWKHHNFWGYRQATRCFGVLEDSLPTTATQGSEERTKEWRGLLGGDYAGLSCTFDPLNGNIIPVPEYLVPESMVEWGQVPNFLEVIVSEDFEEDGFVERKTVSVLPEVGCGVDNLETLSSSEKLQIVKNDDYVVATQQELQLMSNGVQRWKLETVFALGGDSQSKLIKPDSRRLRVILTATQGNLLSPIVVVQERNTGEVSSNGTIADGGGLDGRTVTQLIGSEALKSPFCEESPGSSSANSTPSFRILSLPGNLTVRFGKENEESPFWIMVSHQHNDSSKDDYGHSATEVQWTINDGKITLH